MKTKTRPIDSFVYANYCAMLAHLLPHLDWRHSGLGMLQAYVQEGTKRELRVHIWHPSLRRGGIEESGLLHDHRFDLESSVLVGTIFQEDYELTPNKKGEWALNQVLHARAAAEKNLLGPDRLMGVFHEAPRQLPERYDVQSWRVIVEERHRYYMRKREFHGTNFRGLTVTLVEKSDQDDVPARILAPVDKPIVHAFEKPLPRESWQHVINAAVDALTERWRRFG